MADNLKTRGSNFTTAELNQLCASWCHVSQDPIVGSSQTLKSFWLRTVRHYNANKPPDKEDRAIRSLDSKWSDLKRDVAKFVGCYQTVVDKNISGDGLEDTLKKAKELYVVKDPKGKEFPYLDQWYLLKDCPRFSMAVDDMNQKLAQMKARKQKGKGRFNSDKENDCPNMEAGTIDLEDEEAITDGQRPAANSSSGSLHWGEARPMGNKSAKKLRGDESATKVMAAAQRDMAAISAKRLKLAEKQDLENLLTLRVADIDPECQEYFKACRAKELRIAMAKLQREEEEELRAVRGTRRTPLPDSPPVDRSPVGDYRPNQENDDSPHNQDSPQGSLHGLGEALVDELLALDKDIF